MTPASRSVSSRFPPLFSMVPASLSPSTPGCATRPWLVVLGWEKRIREDKNLSIITPSAIALVVLWSRQNVGNVLEALSGRGHSCLCPLCHIKTELCLHEWFMLYWRMKILLKNFYLLKKSNMLIANSSFPLLPPPPCDMSVAVRSIPNFKFFFLRLRVPASLLKWKWWGWFCRNSTRFMARS